MVGRSLAALFLLPLLWVPSQTAAPRKDVQKTVPAAEVVRTVDLIVDVLTAPNRFWNRVVTFKGHATSTKANPPGTQRGSFMFRDSTDRDIEVQTMDLPSVGTEFFVYGTVLQLTIDTKVPVVHEDARAATLAELEQKIKALNKK